MSLMKCSTKKPRSKLPAMIRVPRFESDQLPAAPEATDCITVSGSANSEIEYVEPDRVPSLPFWLAFRHKSQSDRSSRER
jgi:hypothetical protein